MSDPVQLRDAKMLSQAEYFLKYHEHPAIIIRSDKEESDDCMGCQ